MNEAIQMKPRGVPAQSLRTPSVFDRLTSATWLYWQRLFGDGLLGLFFLAAFPVLVLASIWHAVKTKA